MRSLFNRVSLFLIVRFIAPPSFGYLTSSSSHAATWRRWYFGNEFASHPDISVHELGILNFSVFRLSIQCSLLNTLRNSIMKSALSLQTFWRQWSLVRLNTSDLWILTRHITGNLAKSKVIFFLKNQHSKIISYECLAVNQRTGLNEALKTLSQFSLGYLDVQT